ncbi:hypothetical protein L0F63_006209 [Massospora cicadina]|nr:hypothetical protein L0F63_006209 [Massospora cicadina]
MILIIALAICNLVLAHATKPEVEGVEEMGTWKNVALGFGLVMFGATLSTLGAMVLYLDKLIRKVTNFGPDFSLAESGPFLSSSLSFSAGVLAVTVFINLIPEGIAAFETSHLFSGESRVAAASYFGICMLTVIGFKLLARKRRERSEINHFEAHAEKGDEVVFEESSNMKRLGYEIALAIALHNFPEGFEGGMLFGIALALHKFPEGIMIGVPIFAGTGSKWKAALVTAAASYVTQLLGALFAFALFKVYWNDIIAGMLFLLAASILTNTLFGGMLPLARQYDKQDHYSSPWLAFGVIMFVFLSNVIAE